MKAIKFSILPLILLASTIFCSCVEQDSVLDADIVSFSFEGIEGKADIDNETHTIAAAADAQTDLKRIKAVFALSEKATATIGATAQVSGVTPNDFSGTDPVIYKVTSGDGAKTLDWSVTVTGGKLPDPYAETEILTFTFAGIEGEAVFDIAERTIAAAADDMTELTAIAAVFTLSEGAAAKVGENPQESGVTVNDFTEPVVYTVTGSDGTTADDWTVTITGGKGPAPGPVYVNAISITPETIYLVPGGQQQIVWTVGPEEADDKTVTWSSSDQGVAAVDPATGMVTAGSTPGRATVTATAADAGAFTASCSVVVQSTDGAPVIGKAAGWLETAYVTWTGPEEADGFNVYYSGAGVNEKKIDAQLVRKYQDGTYRADVPGLAAGTYSLRVVPLFSGEEGAGSATTSMLTVKAHDRSGFAFSSASPNKTSSGAYNDDGTLKSDAQVLYITSNTAKTVKLMVKESAGKTTEGTGIGAILKLREKGYDKTPLAIRVIGMVKDSDVDVFGSNNLLEVKNTYNITIEGIGNDATMHGCGIHIRADNNIEVRNMGFMMFPEDGVSLEVDNENIWVHNCDIFYGKEGSGDKDKGDGSLDVKTSGFVTVSYNHFWDSGKANLLGNGSEPAEMVSYHHNWYDHSDSRHPRVRCHTVHVYNNYYDGCAKYGIGASYGSSVFAEGNYFRNTKNPILTKGQGTDTKDNTFDDPSAGMVKAYGNHMEGLSASTFIPYDATSAPVEFDAYVVAGRNDQVPTSVKSKMGGTVYNNFDTNSSIIYSYTADTAVAAKEKVMMYAGRTQGKQGADFDWTFNNAVDDTDYARNASLSSALQNHKSKLTWIQGEGSTGGGSGGDGGDGGDGGGTVIDSAISCVFTGKTPSNSAFTVTGSYSDSKGTVTVNGQTLNICVKMESGTDISFTTSTSMTLTLIFGLEADNAAGRKVKVDGTDYTADGNGHVTVAGLPAGTHHITKNAVMNLFYIGLN